MNPIMSLTWQYGLSEGKYISLGYHEKHQVKNIVDFVEKYPGVGKIGLWGRSMGAATTLIYANMDKRIKAIVVDSPFEDFRKLAKEMVLGQIKLPGFLVEGAISIIGKSVKMNRYKPLITRLIAILRFLKLKKLRFLNRLMRCN